MVDPFLRDFVAECWDNLCRLEKDLAAWESNPARSDLPDEMLRTLHTLKGGCGVLRLNILGRAVHAAESTLAKLRDGSREEQAATRSALTNDLDRIKDLLTTLEATGEEPALELPQGEPPEIPSPAAPSAVTAAPEGIPPIQTESRSRNTAASIRVSVAAIDRLISLVDDLAQTRNHFLTLRQNDDTSALAEPISQLDRLTTELQHGMTKIQMQPVSQAWNSLPRLVSDLSRIVGKRIELEWHGADTELDRTILETLQVPLTHLVRNAADHGIERPDVRRAAGKPEVGRLTLTTVSEAGQVVVSLEDDGAGIPRRQVIQTALRQRLITDADADRLADDDVIRLVFQPGLSTAEQVTTVSGRGIGLDVVRTTIEQAGGSVEMTSFPGRGTKVVLRWPRTSVENSALAGGAIPIGKPTKPSTTKSVLVIDDSLFFRQLVRTALEADGYRTTVAESADRAMDLLRDGNPFDVILCDIEMPGRDGFEFAAWFRERQTNCPAPLVAITSLDRDEHGPRILAAGFDRMLMKFHPQELRQTLKDVLSAPGAARSARCA